MHRVFFFQAEDGIRDLYVTGVQTCALSDLPAARATVAGCKDRVNGHSPEAAAELAAELAHTIDDAWQDPKHVIDILRSEERRVGKECRARIGEDHAEGHEYDT